MEPGKRQKEGPEFPLEVAPEPVGRKLGRGNGLCRMPFNPPGSFQGSCGRGREGGWGGRGGEAEGERAGRGESKVKFSSSPLLVVRTAGSPGGNSVPSTPPSTMAWTLSGSTACSRPPRQGLTDYTSRVNAYKTQPSALHISPPNLERMPA